MKKYLGIILIALGVLIAIYVMYANSTIKNKTEVFSPYSLLESSWIQYKKDFLSPDGRVLDKSQNNITTSEGQSYALLRAVWMDDKETFDKVWKFTKDNMKRPNDNLFGWKWGELGKDKYGFLPDGGENSASDASSDISLALIFAGYRWGSNEYVDEAKKILADMWRLETVEVNGKRYLIAGNWAVNDVEIVVNPSYLSPYAYRVFATADKERDWESLIASSYELLAESSQNKLDKEKSVNLPPDWVAVDRKTGNVAAAKIPNLTSNYSYDAIRVPWRVALDYQWNREQKAYDYLKSLKFLSDTYTTNNKLLAGYTHDGGALGEFESPSMYATALGYFSVIDKNTAKQIYDEKIINLYSSDSYAFKTDLPYYEQNWLWFGAALYNERLVPYWQSDNKEAKNE